MRKTDPGSLRRPDLGKNIHNPSNRFRFFHPGEEVSAQPDAKQKTPGSVKNRVDFADSNSSISVDIELNDIPIAKRSTIKEISARIKKPL